MASQISIEERLRELKKAINDKVPDNILLTHLEKLQGWTANEALLRTTGLGKVVNTLRSTKTQEASSKQAQEVAALAARLINKWKADVKKRPLHQSPAVKKTATNGTAPQTTTVKTESNGTAKFTGDVAKRSAKMDGVKVQVTDNQDRDRRLEGFYKALAYMSDEPSDSIVSRAVEIEQAIYDHDGPETNPEYADRAKMLLSNLLNKTNPSLRTEVLKGIIPPARLVRMTHDELKSDEQRERDRQLQKEVMDEAMVPPETRPKSTMFECGKCKGKETYHTQAQTRSADEPMTNFLECVNCGHAWKFSG